MPMNRPEPSEYHEFYETYVSKADDGGGALAQLEAQISETLEAFSDLDEERALHRYQPDKWSIKEMLGHLIDSERVFAYRAMCIARGEQASLPGMEADDYTAGGRFDRRSLTSLLEEFEHLRRATIALFASLDDESLERIGVANSTEVSVRALAHIIAGHHAHHLGVLHSRYLS